MPLRQPLAAAAEQTGVLGAQNTQVGEAGFGLLSAQRGIAALFSAFNGFAASDKYKRYTQQLDAMLQADIAKFEASVTRGNQEEEDKVSKRGDIGKNYKEEKQKWDEAKQQWDEAQQQQASGPSDLKGKGKQKEIADPGEAPEWQGVPEDIANPSEAYPRLDTLILKKAKKGMAFTEGEDGKIIATDNRKFEYDMDKVAALAASKDPQLAAETLHAKNILLTDHIANQLARKQRNRAIYDGIRNTFGAAGAITAAAASHGTSVAATVLTKDTAVRASGYILAASASGNPGKAIRNRKQLRREEKAQRIESNVLLRRDNFIEAAKNGFTDKEVTATYGVAKRDAGGAIVRDADGVEQTEWTTEKIPERTIPVDEVPPEAIAAARAALRDEAKREINNRNLVGFRTRRIDEDRIYVQKKDRRDDMSEHAYDIIKYHIGFDNPDNIDGFREILKASNDSGKLRDTLLVERIEKSENLKIAYQLLRDMGGGKSEAVQIIRRTMEHAVDNFMSKDPITAKLAGLENYDPARAAKDVTKTIASWLKRR